MTDPNRWLDCSTFVWLDEDSTFSMSKLLTVTMNSGILFVTKLISTILSLFVSMSVVRYLGSDGYGQFSLVFAYLSFFQIITGQGIDTIVLKEISKDVSKQNILIGNAIVIKLLLSILAVLTAWITAFFMHYSSDIRAFIYIASIGMLFSFSSLYTTLFQAHFKVHYYALPELIVNVVFSCLILLMPVMQASTVHFVLLQAATIIPLTVAYIIFSKRIFDFKLQFNVDFSVWRVLFIESWPLFFSALFISVNLRIDQVMLFSLVSSKSLGMYSAVVRLVEALNIIPILFMVPIFPLLCSSFSQSDETFVKMYNISFKYMSIIIIPVSVIMTQCSRQFITLIYGAEFSQASSALSILIWSEVFVFLGTVNANILNASGLQRYTFVFTAAGAVTNAVLNAWLIPQFGIIGSSVATLISYSGFSLLLQYALKETRHIAIDYLRSMIKPVLSSVPVYLFVFFFSSINIFILISVGFLIYIILLIAIRSLTKEDLDYATQIINALKIKSKKTVAFLLA